MSKFMLTNETKMYNGVEVYRLKATEDFEVNGYQVHAGDKGGFVHSLNNLSGRAWIADDAIVTDNATVFGKALIKNTAVVSGYAMVSGKAIIKNKASVGQHAKVTGSAVVSGSAKVTGYANVDGDTKIKNTAIIKDYARVTDQVTVSGHSEVSGRACLTGNVFLKDKAKVEMNAVVTDNVFIQGSAKVYGRAKVSGSVKIQDEARVYDDAKVSDNVSLGGEVKISTTSEISGAVLLDQPVNFRGAKVSSNHDYLIFRKSHPASDGYFLWMKSNNNWSDGGFCGNSLALLRRAYEKSTECGDYYNDFVKIVTDMYDLPKVVYNPPVRTPYNAYTTKYGMSYYK